MRRSVFLLLVALAGCGGSGVGLTSDYLEPLASGDDPYPGVAGERCNLATQAGLDSAIRLVAFRDSAVVRIDGEPVRLRFEGRDMRGGGTFIGEAVAVEIGGISELTAGATPGIGRPAVVALRRGDSIENFEAVWTCGARATTQAVRAERRVGPTQRTERRG